MWRRDAVVVEVSSVEGRSAPLGPSITLTTKYLLLALEFRYPDYKKKHKNTKKEKFPNQESTYTSLQ